MPSPIAGKRERYEEGVSRVKIQTTAAAPGVSLTKSA